MLNIATRSAFLKFFVLIFMLPAILSCNKKEVKIPSYIHIDQVTLSTDPLLEGSNSSRITDAWVSLDGQLIGTFELPATVPVLADEGSHTITVAPGILVNGISSSRAEYPFFSAYATTLNLTKESYNTLIPGTTYLSSAHFVWKENFDNSSFSIEKTGRSDATITIQKATGTLAFEGSGSAMVSMTSGQTIFECASVDEYGLPKDGSDIYLELNFKSNVNILVGLYTSASSGTYQEPVETLVPAPEWKKIYIYLTSVAGLHADAGGHKVFFGVTGDGSVNPEFFFDNIKLIY